MIPKSRQIFDWLPGAATALAILFCYGTLAFMALSAIFGVPLAPSVQTWSGALCLVGVAATLVIAFNCRRRRLAAPVFPAVAGAMLILADIYAGAGPVAEFAGFALLVVATLWDWRLRRWPRGGASEVAWIEADELRRRLAGGRPPVILDVRDPGEFAGELGHLDSARNIPLAELPRRLAELGEDRNRELTLVCRTDIRSAKAAALLREAGFRNLAVLRGGMLAWRRAKPRRPAPTGAAAELTD